MKREFPRIPFYDRFQDWAEWGRQLFELHSNYEAVSPFKLSRIERIFEIDNPEALVKLSKAKLRADQINGQIEIDGFTTLEGIPRIAWEYKLGNRSAIEWVLDQYKESKPKDPTISEKFNDYRFSDYKEKVIELLGKVCTVSIETMKIIAEMEKVLGY